MWFHSLFDTLIVRPSRTRSPKRLRAPSVSRRPRIIRPLLETLEDRSLPSVYTVNVLTDTGAGTGLTGDLRYCVAHATSGNDTISFAPGLSGTINLESALPALNASVAIQGPGASQITVERDPNPANYTYIGIFTVGRAATVEISGLTLGDAVEGAITNAGTLTVSATTLSGNNNYGIGGAINNSGTAAVSDSTFSGNGDSAIANTGTLTINNSTLSGNGGAYIYLGTFEGLGGGAIYNTGTLTINDSTLSGNVVGYEATEPAAGGAIYMGGGTLAINNSTIAGNGAYGHWSSVGYSGGSPATSGLGGGLYVAAGTVTIDHSTIADNDAAGGGTLYGYGPGAGGGIYNAADASAIQMHDTILADNTTNDYGPDLYGGVTSLGYNLIGNTADGSGFAPSDLVNVNPQLGALQTNGGPTQTMALLAGSPAIDAGDNTGAPAYDQRGPGYARIVNNTIDIGAFEVQSGSASQAASLAVSGFPSVITAGNSGSFTVTALYADGSTDTGYTGTVHFTSADGQAVLPADYTFTAADAGVHTFSATLKTAGTQSLTATDTMTGVTGGEAGITVIPAAASKMIVTGFPSPTTAGVAHTFTVTLEDTYGNIATGYTGTVHFTSSDGKATLPTNYTFTTSDAGQHTFSATLKTAGTQSLTATDTTMASLTGTDAGILVHPAAASQFLINAPASVRSGVSFSLTLTVEDAYGNVVTGYSGTVHFSSSDSSATLPRNYTFTSADQGKHTFSGLVLRKKGYQRITITDTHNSSLSASVIVDVL